MSANDEAPREAGAGAGERPPRRFPTVGIGASAGGVNALQRFFEVLPSDVEAAFVVVVHLDPAHESELPSILATRTKMPVTQVTGRTRLEPGHVYVIPPNRQLLITDHHLALAEFDEPRWQRAPIDLFFRSLAAQRGDDFAIVFSGAGSDGAVGIKAIKEAGGIIVVQDPDEAEYSAMPRAAVATGIADFILPIREIATKLPEIIRDRGQGSTDVVSDAEAEAMQRILSHLRVRTGHDFSAYKKSTVRRRIARRMQVQRASTMADYLSILRESGAEAQALFADLLISVTTFFRDAAAFDKLAKIAVPVLFAAAAIASPLARGERGRRPPRRARAFRAAERGRGQILSGAAPIGPRWTVPAALRGNPGQRCHRACARGTELRSAHRPPPGLRAQRPSLSGPIAVRFNGSARRVYLQAKPVGARLDAGTAIVFFFEGEALGNRREARVSRKARPANGWEQLQQELQFTQSQLRTSREGSRARRGTARRQRGIAVD